MLTGRRAFVGEDVSGTLAAVIRDEPDLDTLPHGTPTSIRRLLRRCLSKAQKSRLADIADARIELTDPDPQTQESAERPPPTWMQPRWLALVGAVLIAVTWNLARSASRSVEPDPTVTRYVIGLPESDTLNMITGGLALSPDGRNLVYVAVRDGVKQLFLRQREDVTAIPLPGTEDAVTPFFSPNGQWIAFFRGATLMKISLAGGSPQRICETNGSGGGAGGSWGEDDTIVSGVIPGGAYSVNASGGSPVPLESKGQQFPYILPNRKNVILEDPDERKIVAHDLTSGEDRVLLDGGQPRVVADHLVVSRERSLWAVPFDLENALIAGAAFPLLDRVSTHGYRGMFYDVATDGTLVFVPSAPSGQLTIVGAGWRTHRPRPPPDLPLCASVPRWEAGRRRTE